MNPTRSLIAALGAAVLLALGACGGSGGGGGGDNPGGSGAVQVDTARTARATVGPAGGSVSTTAADGRVYTLTVPAGALPAAVEITAAPVGSMGSAPLAAGLKGAVRFGPAGLKFNVPALLRIEGAATTAAAGRRLVGFVRSDDGATMNLVPVAVAGAALELPVLHFSDGGVSEASAAELAAIPLAPIVDPVQELWDIAQRESSADGNVEVDAAMLVRLHDQKLSPLLTQAVDLAGDASQDTFRETTIAVWAAWQRVVDFTTVPADRLGGRVAQARTRAGQLLADQVARGRAACAAPPPVGLQHVNGLWRALWAQKVAQLYGLDAPDLGLDAGTVARGLNDCARVVFVPKVAPTFEAGRPVSLDAQAELILAEAPNAPAPVEFGFTVSSADAAIANPSGFSDLEGRYTTVVTPRAAGAVIDVRACLVTYMANLAPVASVMCATQTVAGGGGDPAVDSFGLAGSATRRSGTASDRRDDIASVVMQGRALVGGSDVQTVAASGTFSTVFTRQERCGANLERTVELTTTLSGNITEASLVLPAGVGQSGAFSVGGRGRTEAQSVDLQTCAISTVGDPTERSLPGPVFGVLRVSRDAQGRLLSVDLGDAAGPQGTLARQ